MKDTLYPLENISSLITFQLSDQMFCINMQNILQIVDPAKVDPYADLNSEDSYINIDNKKIPMVDLNKLVGISDGKKLLKDNRILAIEYDNYVFGIWVEKVHNIYSLDLGLKEKIEFNENNEILYIEGTLEFNKQKMFLLDLKELILASRNIS